MSYKSVEARVRWGGRKMAACATNYNEGKNTQTIVVGCLKQEPFDIIN